MFKKKQATVTVQIEGNVQWTIGFDQEAGEWVGVCRALNLNAIGSTYQDCVSMASEAMALLFQDLFATGELNAFLYRNGWRLKTPLPAPGTKTLFDLPFSLNQANVEEVLAAAH